MLLLLLLLLLLLGWRGGPNRRRAPAPAAPLDAHLEHVDLSIHPTDERAAERGQVHAAAKAGVVDVLGCESRAELRDRSVMAILRAYALRH